MTCSLRGLTGAIGLLGLFAISTVASAQGGKHAVVRKGMQASAIETGSFFPQIDESYRWQPLHPENPPLSLPNTGPSRLRSGNLTGAARGRTSAQFPAIGATGWTPPDADLAVGPNHIVATVNSSIAFFTKAGVKQFQQSSSTFFTGLGAGSFQFDPKCFYDRISGRFVILFLEEDDATQTSKLLLAVSDDSDPNGTWFRYRLESKLTVGASSYWLDYPGFGYNKDAYVVSGNMFGFTSGFAGIQFIVIPKTPLLTGAPATTFSLRDATTGSAQIAEVINPTTPYVFAAAHSGTTQMRLYAILNPGTAPTVTFQNVGIPSSPGPSRTANSTNARTLDTIDGRVFNVLWRDGRLVTAHNSTDTNISIHWHEFNTNNWPASGTASWVQTGTVANATADYHMNAISRNAQGDIAMIFTSSSPSLTANLNYVGRTYFDAAGTMGSVNLLESSAGNNYTQGRWGDYFGVDVDPVDDNTFWGIGMTVAAGNNWTTSIYSWVITPPLDVTGLSLNPTTVIGGAANSTGTITFNHQVGPNGATVQLSSSDPSVTVPASVAATTGNTSVTFTATTSAVSSVTPVVITATYGSTVKQATLTVNPATIQLLGNPGFETGSAPPWTVTTGSIIDNDGTYPPHGGGWKAILGGYGTNHQDTLAQTVTIPSNATTVTLKYWLWVDSTQNSPRAADRSKYDWCSVRIRDAAGNLLRTLKAHNNNEHNTSYFLKTYDISEFKGQTVTLSIELEEDVSLPSRFIFDDFEMTASF